MQKQTRRDILVLSAATAAGIGIAAAAGKAAGLGIAVAANTAKAEGDDALLLRCEDHWRWLQGLINDPRFNDEETNHFFDVRDRLEEYMMRIPARGVDGLMVKARRVEYWFDGGSLKFSMRGSPPLFPTFAGSAVRHDHISCIRIDRRHAGP